MNNCFRRQHTKLSYEWNVHVTAVVCNLIVHRGFLPVIFMGPKNFRYLGSTEHLYLKRVAGFANFAKPQVTVGGQDIKNGLLLFATAISFSQRMDDLYDPYCIVKTRLAYSVHFVYRYLLLEGTGV